MPRVCFADVGRVVDWTNDEPLLRCALAEAIEISHECGGDGACGTCRIEILEGWERLTPLTMDEIARDLERPYRLSCQAKTTGDVVIRIARIE